MMGEKKNNVRTEMDVKAAAVCSARAVTVKSLLMSSEVREKRAMINAFAPVTRSGC